MEILYPPPYFSDVWYYEDANNDLIERAIDIFDWDKAIVSTNVNEKVLILNKTTWNIFSSYIPHKTLIFDDKEPPWVTKKISCKRKITFIKAIEIVKTTTTYNT